MSYDPRLPLPNSGITDPADKLYSLDSHFQRTWIRLTELFTEINNRLDKLERSRILSVQTTLTGTPASTALTTLFTYTLPANTLRVGQRIRLKAFGLFAANGNTKTVTITFGGSTAVSTTGAYNNVAWIMETEIGVVSTLSQAVWGTAIVNTATQVNSFNLAKDLSTALVISVTAQNGTATANDITCSDFSVTIE